MNARHELEFSCDRAWLLALPGGFQGLTGDHELFGGYRELSLGAETQELALPSWPGLQLWRGLGGETQGRDRLPLGVAHRSPRSSPWASPRATEERGLLEAGLGS